MDIDIQILDYIAEKSPVRTGDLIKHFIEEGFKKNVSKGTSLKKKEEKTKISARTIHRKLKQMTDRGQIVALNAEQAKRHGKEDPDGRANYLTLKTLPEITEHMNKVFENLDSEEPIKKKMALKEIARYEQIYVLNSVQLDLVITHLGTVIDLEIIDNELADKLLFLLYRYILEKKIEPLNKAKTIDLLVKMLNKYPIPIQKYGTLRTHIIYLLGHYEQEVVFDRILEDIRTLEDPFTVENDYISKYTANLIEKHREELYKLEEELAMEGKDYASQFVSNVRTHALINLDYHKNPFKKGKKKW